MRTMLPVTLLLALIGAGCDNSGSATVAPTPVAPTTEMFTGTVDPGGSASHNFTVSQAGEIDITLTAAGPPTTIFMGLGIGTPSGTTCTLLSNGSLNTQAGTVPQLSGTAPAGP